MATTTTFTGIGLGLAEHVAANAIDRTRKSEVRMPFCIDFDGTTTKQRVGHFRFTLSLICGDAPGRLEARMARRISAEFTRYNLLRTAGFRPVNAQIFWEI
jgi:hypothetical protein